HSNRGAMPDRFREFRECFHPRHPDVVFFDQRSPLLARSTEQLFFGLLDESKEMRVINDTGRVDIAPIRLQPDFEHSSDDSIRGFARAFVVDFRQMEIFFSDFAQNLGGPTNPLYQLQERLNAEGAKVTDLVRGNVNEHGIVYPPEILAEI